MIVLRSEREISAIRKAGEITAATLNVLKKTVSSGITTAEIDRIAEEEIRSRGGLPAFKGYRGFPATICASINEIVVHGIPSKRVLQNGDILSIDIGVKYERFFADAAITVGVGTISAADADLIAVTEEALYTGLGQIEPGKRLSAVSCAIQDYVESNGFSVVRSFVGHGIGTRIHEEPEIPNFGKRGTGPRLEKGMVLAIEPMVNAGGYDVEILDDGWTAVTCDGSRSAHFEHTAVVTDTGFAILTTE